MCGRYMGSTKGQSTKDERGEAVCEDCITALPRTEQAAIRQNGTEMALTGKTKDIVAAAKAMHLTRAAAFLFYEKDDPIQRLIHRMKYSDQPLIGYQLGRQAAMEVQDTDFFDGIELIIPIPLHPRRLRERGYNQSEYIARGISDYTGIPVDTSHVTRVRNTPKQAMQSGEGRKHNVEDAFGVNHPEQMYHKHILLVDDLVTTGETARSCIRAMRLFRGAKITVFALCKAR